MYGRGYRPPLSFFESQHGLNEDGFVMAIQRPETSHSFGYSLAFSKPGFNFTWSSHATGIWDLAYARQASIEGDPAVFLNHPGALFVWANDVVASVDVAPNWNLQFSYENFQMENGYKSLLPAAAIENRIRLVSDWHIGNWEFVNTFTFVGARDLRPYNYAQHYRTISLQLIDPEDPPLGTELKVDQSKGLNAPGYFTWDVYLGWTYKSKYTFFASVQNVFGFTQTSAGDSPLNWSAHRAETNHFHLDNNHTWGPLRGRIFSVGLKAEI